MDIATSRYTVREDLSRTQGIKQRIAQDESQQPDRSQADTRSEVKGPSWESGTVDEQRTASPGSWSLPSSRRRVSYHAFGAPVEAKHFNFPGIPDLTLPKNRPQFSKRHPHPRLHYMLDVAARDHTTIPALPIKSQRFPPSAPTRNTYNRPPLPFRYASTQAGAIVLSEANQDDKIVTMTVKMARGNLDKGSSPESWGSPPDGGGSTDLSCNSSWSPLDDRDTTIRRQTLSLVGIAEILEMVDRPTFIIDLGDPANFQPGPLIVLCSNSALRAYEGLIDAVTGHAIHVPLGVHSSFHEFKLWCMGFVKDHQSMDVCLPSFLFNGIMWACTTIEKTLRLFSGDVRSASPDMDCGSPPTKDAETVPNPSSEVNGFSTASLKHAHQGSQETLDYFGDAEIPMNSDPQYDDSRHQERSRSCPPIETLEDGAPSRDVDPSTSTESRPDRPWGTDDPSSSSSKWSTDALSKTTATSHVNELFTTSVYRDPESFDWTRLPITPSMPQHIRFARSIDWAATSVGPMETWPPELRGMCNLIMASPYPAIGLWGDEYISIYNEGYILLAGQKHPSLMGMSFREAWAEIWDVLEDSFQQARMTGLAAMTDDHHLFVWRTDFLEETFFSWGNIPLLGKDGSVIAHYCPCFEMTRRKVAERRMLTLREVGDKTAAVREVKRFWGKVLEGLEYNKFDTPFVILYSASYDFSDGNESSRRSSSIAGVKDCVLEGTLGVPNGHQAAPAQMDLRVSKEGFAPVFKEAMLMDRPILLEVETGTLDKRLLEGINWRGFGEPCTAAVVSPIRPTTGESILGFLVMGINPRRPYDDDYSLFVQLLTRQLATATASVVLFEAEIKRGQRTAKILSTQLTARTQEAVESETKFTRMAEFTPVGMFIANSKGRITYCNGAWYEITRHPKEEKSRDEWMNSIKDEDKDKVSKLWNSLVIDKIPMSAEFRFKTPWRDQNNEIGETWVLASAYPQRNEDGTLKSIFGSLTNISQQKWAEDFQKRRREEAVELKRQQENFIDITSHEMRNPLSAILQSADEISTTLTDYQSGNPSNKTMVQILESNNEAAQTIILCANHQKRIVDDVLTLSKLDSALLVVTPVDVQPVSVVQGALKMFEAEIKTADICMEFKIDDSFIKLRIDWVRIDPSRLLQVLINLLTNAIKFTAGRDKRAIDICLSASMERPSSKDTYVVDYFPTRSKRKDLTESADWGTGEQVYIHFAVRDSGRGLSEGEVKRLFHRHTQASPRTHVQYGGSGLGLFISRELAELQGGEIGVSSEAGVGSTFAFYLKARRSGAPKDAVIPTRSPGAPRNRAAETKSFKAGISKDIPKLNIAPVAPSVPNLDLNILIVEDNLVNQKVLQKQLRNKGCVAYIANHGGECIDLLKGSTFWTEHTDTAVKIDVVLMDQEMPVMDGLECTRKIRELQGTGEVIRHVPIIAVSANARAEQVATALSMGVDDVVSKPFLIPALMTKISELLERYPKRR